VKTRLLVRDDGHRIRPWTLVKHMAIEEVLRRTSDGPDSHWRPGSPAQAVSEPLIQSHTAYAPTLVEDVTGSARSVHANSTMRR
jgi:hypothetical protein